MLACAAIGGSCMRVFVGFAATILAVRMMRPGRTLILTASCGIRGSTVLSPTNPGDAGQSMEAAPPGQACVVYQRARNV